MKRIALTVAALGILVTGCTSAPKCSDKKTVALVKQIFTEEYAKRVPGKTTFELDAISTYSTDKETGKQGCSATIAITSEALGNQTMKVPVRYTSGLTDDKQHIVQIIN